MARSRHIIRVELSRVLHIVLVFGIKGKKPMQRAGHTWGRWRRVCPRQVGFGKPSRFSSQNDAWAGIEDQPDERPDGRVFPVTRQAELRMPGTIDCALEREALWTSCLSLITSPHEPNVKETSP